MRFHPRENFSRSPVGETGQDLGLPPAWGAAFWVKTPCLGLCGEERPHCAPRPTDPLPQRGATGWHRGWTDPARVSLGFAAREVTRAGILFLGDAT